MSYDDNPLPLPEFISLNNIAGLLSIASADFYRTAFNNNIEIFAPQGAQVNLFTSPDIYLPNACFNGKNETVGVKYTNNRDVFIKREVTCLHKILLQFKLTKTDNTNYANQRELRFTLVKADGTVYDQAIFANYQPDTGQHTTAALNGTIIHTVGDVVKIKLNLIQDNTLTDNSDTLLTIFNISWNIEILKNF